jgi:hypothetical protein
MTFRAGGFALIAAVATAVGCSSDIEIGQDHLNSSPAGGMAGAGIVGGSGGSDAGTAGTAGGDCQVTECQGMKFACGNCLDDDADGAVDSDDIHCTGPCDDDESSYAIDIHAGNATPCKLDCFFDSDLGSGNDGCNWSHTCDPLSVPPEYQPSGDARCAYDENANIPGMSMSCDDARNDQDAMCDSTCGPLIPNGCDCFGCCELPVASGRHVWLGSENPSGTKCTEETLTDPSVCHPCTPVPSCMNTCEACEICVGRTTTGANCGSGEPPMCPTGMAACSDDGPRCGLGYYCITGCCVPEPR